MRVTATETVRAHISSVANSSAKSVIIGKTGAYIEVVRDNSGAIVMLETKSNELSRTEKEIIGILYEELFHGDGIKISIPIGTLSGLSFLSGLGADYTVKAIPLGGIEGKYYSDFFGMGINQTRLMQYIRITLEVKVILAGSSENVTVHTDILVGDTIIVGKIPEIYLGSSGGLKLYP